MNTLNRGINRRTFILGYILFFISAIIVAAAIRNSDSLSFLGWVYGVFVAMPVVLYLLIARLHDIGTSGWWSLLIFIPVINFLTVVALAVWPGKKL